MTTPTRPLTVAEAAYLAGFLDGEGSFYMTRERRAGNRSGYRFACGLSAAQVQIGVLSHIQSFAGGTITYADRGNPKHQPIYTIYWGPQKIKWLVPQLMPYLVRKRDVATEVLKFANLRRPRANYSQYDAKTYTEIYNQVKSLNKTGRKPHVDIPVDEPRPHKSRPVTACKIDGCDERKFAQGLCRKHHREKYLNKNEAGPKNCAHCGILMEEARPDQKYCGHSCQMKAYRRRKKAASSPDNLPQDQSYD